MSSLFERELENRELIYKALNASSKKERKEFEKMYKERAGTSQWSDMSYNILSTKSACFNDCKYCYVKPMFRRFGIGGDRKVTLEPELDEKKVEKGWAKSAKKKTIMFPTSHDIFPSIVDSYIKVCRKMIKAGHKVLCVSKPRFECVKAICDALADVKESIIFRFTIGSDNNEVLAHWEPNAPKFEERLESLKYAFEKGFQTSVSMEPILDDPTSTIEKVYKHVNETIWIGFVNHVPNTDLEDISFVKSKTKTKMILDLLERYRDDRKVMWKESVAKYVFKM